MKIINIVPGFGGTFYCGNCLRDREFTYALKDSGHDAVSLPIYLPLTIENGVIKSDKPIFFSAVTIYMKQKFPFMRHMPKWMERFFNSQMVMKYAAKKSGSTRATGLEEMTISMLNGDEGYQKDELRQLIDFLRDYEKPDVVHLSNALLMGVAKQIKEELNIPIVCSLQDEDVWVDAMSPSYQQKMWDLLSEKGKDIDAFVSVSQYFADFMKKNMRIPDEKMHVVHIGVDPAKYNYHKPQTDNLTIGYLSRIYKENGFGVLVDAFIHLKKQLKYANAKLKITGGMTGDDKRFINKQIRKLKRNKLIDYVEFIDDFKVESLNDFFKDLTLLSVPVLKGEAFGPYQLESLACGIPLVQPALGAFPEIAKTTKGGFIYEPNSPEVLASKWEEVFENKEVLIQASENGRKAVLNEFSTKALTKKMIAVYEKVTSKNKKEILINK
jgi:glycosyltransferase involved in cell wall biosynthesis